MKKFYDTNSCTVIDLHAYEWDSYPCRSTYTAAMVNAHLPEGGVVVDYGCGQMYVKKLLRDDIVYIPIDIVSRGKGCIICDFSSGEPLPKVKSDIAILNGVMQLGEKYDRRLIKHIVEYSDFVLTDRRVDNILGGDTSAQGYRLKLVTKQEFPHGAHDGRPQDEYLFESIVERGAELGKASDDSDDTIEECPFGPISPASKPRQGVEVGSRWQGIPGDAWAGKIATIASCEPLDKGRGTVEVQYEEGGWDSFWLDSFLNGFQMMCGG